ncbi:recombinase family protein [Shewanella sp. MBTL60-007]|uniref:recombinase family protein n=1 Tax=Shewanella sp. MBTL60-007 TaxID=2815911 RepID=UPI001BC6760E|nr:recombinase family protein [Shewanella sp. MBTL60-007]GIU30685.1 serine recombinase PinR [Shewanella sp. MBTL60-007]
MAMYAYLRVSTVGQDVAAQYHEVTHKYPELTSTPSKIKQETISGTVPALERPVLGALVEHVLERDDTLVVWKLDRLGRNTADILNLLERLEQMGVKVRCMNVAEGMDLSSPTGVFMLTMLAAVAEMERSTIAERMAAGRAAAKAEGKSLGRKFSFDHSEVAKWRVENSASIAETAKHFNTSVATVKRACK